MKFIRDKVKPYYQKTLYRLFLNEKYEDVISKRTLDKFISFGVSFTNILLNVGLFFSMYYIFVTVLFDKLGFEKTVLVAIIVIITLFRAFLEEFT